MLGHNYTDGTLLRMRQEFCGKLIDYMKQGREILFFDETSINSWMFPGYVWQRRTQPVYARLPTSRNRSRTVLGCMSSKRTNLWYTCDDGTNTENVLSFFRYLRESLDEEN